MSLFMSSQGGAVRKRCTASWLQADVLVSVFMLADDMHIEVMLSEKCTTTDRVIACEESLFSMRVLCVNFDVGGLRKHIIADSATKRISGWKGLGYFAGFRRVGHLKNESAFSSQTLEK